MPAIHIDQKIIQPAGVLQALQSQIAPNRDP